MKYLEQGEPVTGEEILDQREMRGNLLAELTGQYPKETLVSFKLNIPGPIKNNDLISRIFDGGVEKIREVLDNPVVCALTNDKTGPELILRVSEEARTVKTKLIRLEEATPIARLYDIDVLFIGTAVSRKNLGQQERTCLICSRPAKLCARSAAHSLAELQQKMEELILADPRLNESDR